MVSAFYALLAALVVGRIEESGQFNFENPFGGLEWKQWGNKGSGSLDGIIPSLKTKINNLPDLPQVKSQMSEIGSQIKESIYKFKQNGRFEWPTLNKPVEIVQNKISNLDLPQIRKRDAQIFPHIKMADLSKLTEMKISDLLGMLNTKIPATSQFPMNNPNMNIPDFSQIKDPEKEMSKLKFPQLEKELSKLKIPEIKLSGLKLPKALTQELSKLNIAVGPENPDNQHNIPLENSTLDIPITVPNKPEVTEETTPSEVAKHTSEENMTKRPEPIEKSNLTLKLPFEILNIEFNGDARKLNLSQIPAFRTFKLPKSLSNRKIPLFDLFRALNFNLSMIMKISGLNPEELPSPNSITDLNNKEQSKELIKNENMNISSKIPSKNHNQEIIDLIKKYDDFGKPNEESYQRSEKPQQSFNPYERRAFLAALFPFRSMSSMDNYKYSPPTTSTDSPYFPYQHMINPYRPPMFPFLHPNPPPTPYSSMMQSMKWHYFPFFQPSFH